MERIKYTIEFQSHPEQALWIKVGAGWKNEEVNLSPSAFLMFLYNNEKELHKEDAEFAYSLAKLLKRIRLNNQIYNGLVNDEDMVLFFDAAKKNNIIAFWQNKGQTQALAWNETLPINVSVKQKAEELVCRRTTPRPENPAYEMLFQGNNKSYYFFEGHVLGNPTDSLLEFLETLETNNTKSIPNQEVTSFVQTIYKPNKTFLAWQIQADFTAFIPSDEPPTPKLTLTYEHPRLIPELSYLYGEKESFPGDEDQIIKNDKTGQLHERQLEMEDIFQQDLMDLFEKYDLPFLLNSPDKIGIFLDKAIPALEAREWKIINNSPDFKLTKEPVALSFGFNGFTESGQDWFRFDHHYKIDGSSFTFPEIARMLVENQGYIRTKTGIMKISEESKKKLTSLNELGVFKPHQKFSKAQMIPILAFSQQLKGKDQKTEALIATAETFKEIKAIYPGKGFKGTLRDYQQFGLNWLSFLNQNGFGGILADDMGLGKTIQAIALASKIENNDPILIIGPTNVLYNWEQEIHKFLPGQKVTVYTGSNRIKNLEALPNQKFIITSFGIIKNDLSWLNQIQYAAIFVDEAQNIKNQKTLASKALKTLNAQFKLAMTGTPIENHIQDLWNIFDFVLPDYLGSAKSFEDHLKNDNANIIKTKIRPFILRREKKEVLASLPDKTELTLRCTMSEEQARLYETIIKAAKEGIRNSQGKTQRLNILAALLKLRQVCTHPGLLQEFKDQYLPSTKFQVLQETLDKLMDEGHKVVIFSQFTGMLDIIEKWIGTQSYQFERIDGSVSAKARMTAVTKFQESQNPGIFLISLKAGGVGLNLTAADYVIHMDPWWNPATEAQATDRVHRIGQTNKVFVYRLITEGTIEEKVQDLQESKRRLMAEIIDIDNANEKAISFEDIKGLLFT